MAWRTWRARRLRTGKAGADGEVRDLALRFRIGAVVFVTQAKIERQTGAESEIVLRVNVKRVGAEIIGIRSRLQRALLRQSEQEIGEIVAGVRDGRAGGACESRSGKAGEDKTPLGVLRGAKTLEDAAVVSAKVL